MISILAPSKTLDFSARHVKFQATSPLFKAKAIRIIDELSLYSVEELGKLMHVSKAIASINYKRFIHFGARKQASVYAYRGDVYKGFYADSLTESDIEWARQRVFIMSGLYGILRLTDEISPYRLEMKQKFSVDGHKGLYELWGRELSRYADTVSGGVICVLSSDEYAKVIIKYSSSKIVTPLFFDSKSNGTQGVVPIYSKMMRGVMARWIIDHRVDDPEELKKFKGHGYSYDESLSEKNHPAFSREIVTPLVFL